MVGEDNQNPFDGQLAPIRTGVRRLIIDPQFQQDFPSGHREDRAANPGEDPVGLPTTFQSLT